MDRYDRQFVSDSIHFLKKAPREVYLRILRIPSIVTSTAKVSTEACSCSIKFICDSLKNDNSHVQHRDTDKDWIIRYTFGITVVGLT